MRSILPTDPISSASFRDVVSQEKDKAYHQNTFKVSLDGTKKRLLYLHATSKVERDQWIETLGAAIMAIEFRKNLEKAQKTDMLAAMRCQGELETFLENNVVVYAGFLEKLSIKSQRNWKVRWFELTVKGELKYSADDTSKKVCILCECVRVCEGINVFLFVSRRRRTRCN